MGKQLNSAPIEQEVRNLYGDVEFDHNALNPDAPNSRVYRFLIKANGEVKVIKVLTGSFRQKDTEVYEREKRAMLQCKNDKVIAFEADGIVGKNYYFIFPFIDGKTLNDLLRTKGHTFSEEDIYGFLTNVIGIISHLYECGVVHQDIKPANIIYKSPTDFLLLDLGISLFLHEDPSVKKGKGPLHYLSPEQIALHLARRTNTQNKVNFPSDYYSLGLIGLEMVTGKKICDIVSLDKIHEICTVIAANTSISPKLKQLLIALLQTSPISRVKMLNEIGGIKIPVQNRAAVDPVTWIQLTGSDHRKFLIEEYFTEYEPKNMGVVLSGDQIRNEKKAMEDMQPLVERGLKIVTDPRTMRLYDKKISHLQYRAYNGLVEDADLSKAVFEFEKQFNPAFYISPYFYVDDDLCHSLQRCLICFRHFKSFGIEEDNLYFGIALSESLMSNADQLQEVIDFLSMCEEFKNIYVVFGAKKSSIAGPIRDPKWISGVKSFLEQVGLTKKVFWSLSDLSAFYYIGSCLNNFSIAPSQAGRKCNFEKFNESGGGNSNAKKQRYYSPQLLNDIYVEEELYRSSANGIPAEKELKYDGVFYNKGIRNENVNRAHFVEVMTKEKEQLLAGSAADVRKTFVERLKKAEQLYPELEKKYGFQFHESTNSSFISAWLSVLK